MTLKAALVAGDYKFLTYYAHLRYETVGIPLPHLDLFNISATTHIVKWTFEDDLGRLRKTDCGLYNISNFRWSDKNTRNSTVHISDHKTENEHHTWHTNMHIYVETSAKQLMKTTARTDAHQL